MCLRGSIASVLVLVACSDPDARLVSSSSSVPSPSVVTAPSASPPTIDTADSPPPSPATTEALSVVVSDLFRFPNSELGPKVKALRKTNPTPAVERIAASVEALANVAGRQDATDPALDAVEASVRAYAAALPDDPRAQSQLALTIFALSQIGFFEKLSSDKATARRRALVALSKALIQRFPSDAGAQSVGGMTCDATVESDPLDCIRAFKRCRDLEPPRVPCSAELERLRVAYLRPRCSQNDLRPGLAIYGAGGSPDRDADPTFTVADFAGAQEVVAMPGDTRTSVSLIVAPASRAKLATWTGELAAARRSLSFMDGPRELVTAQVITKISGPSLLLGGFGIDAVCAQSTVAPLPPDLVD